MAAPIHAARQNKADLEAAIHTLKAEARKLMDVPAKDRTAEQTARLDAIDADLDAKNADLGATLKDIQRLERYQQTERESAGRVEVGTDHATERPWGPDVAADASPLVKAEARHLALGTFAIAVKTAALGQGLDPRLMAAATGAGTQTDSNLGFAVPMEVAPASSARCSPPVKS
jgi:hypothetical protein